MRIILNEIKKIFNLKSLIIGLIISIIMFGVFSAYFIKNFPDGQPAGCDLEMMKELRMKYGTTLNTEEEKELGSTYLKEKENEADQYIQNHKEAQRLGVTSYKGIRKHLAELKEKNENDEIEQLYFKMSFEEDSQELWNMQGINYVNEVLTFNSRYNTDYKEKKKIDRFNEIANREVSLITEIVIDNFDSYIEGVGAIVIFLIMFFLGTVFIKDRKEKVDYIQYTSKIGREITKKKIVAAMISALLITTTTIAISMIVYFVKCGTTEFFNVDINSVFNKEYIIDITYLQFIILKIIIIYVIGIITAIVTLIISKTGKSYLAILSIGIMSFAFINIITKDIILNNILELSRNQGIVFGSIGILILIGIVGCIKLKKKEIDILY
ncbi:hypothetical protein [uncultured Clostridium sp.]|uniref:hypothetical protein n=1 Tax=uncultured Clostridium sp. TaxID=59620 RepID=UPI00263773B8|nr:hypothetical protein [uncultured Clostridium sp.]